ncbi:MAG: adenylyl-sulfate kinase [Peptococcaceae bacterium]|nr:adenylyl-sulfate kinase [Peptococcaceae bacterium]
MAQTNNLSWHSELVTRVEREQLLGQRGRVVWFTGLSGSGKSSLAHALNAKLHAMGLLVYTLDGDNIRHGLNKNLGFAVADRNENIRRIGEVAKLMVDAGIIVLATFISPLRAEREGLRHILAQDLIEVFVDCPLEVCESRDPKDLYKKARAGAIADFTGISSPYEAPLNADLVINTAAAPLEECVAELVDFLQIAPTGENHV